MGEKLDDFEQFHPQRMASRILGMGDVLTLIERAQTAVDEDDAKKLAARLKENTFGMDDLLDQMRQIKKMGSSNVNVVLKKNVHLSLIIYRKVNKE